MSIKLEFSKGSLQTQVLLKDEALAELMQLFARFETSSGSQISSAKQTSSAVEKPSKDASSSGEDAISKVKHWLARHTASEVLNLTKWKSHHEKILLLGAFHESNGGSEGWKSSDIEGRYDQAKETFPTNFPRDIRIAVDEGVVGAVTSRTYKVGRAGWNKIAEAIEKITH